MPPGPPKGTRPSGRKKGTPNKSTLSIQEKLDAIGCDPYTGMATIAINKLPCGVCRGKGKTPYKTEDGEIRTRKCESCYGTLFEACSPELRGKMYAELAQYVGAKRKAIEMSGSVNTGNAEAILESRRKRMEEQGKIPLTPDPFPRNP